MEKKKNSRQARRSSQSSDDGEQRPNAPQHLSGPNFMTPNAPSLPFFSDPAYMSMFSYMMKPQIMGNMFPNYTQQMIMSLISSSQPQAMTMFTPLQATFAKQLLLDLSQQLIQAGQLENDDICRKFFMKIQTGSAALITEPIGGSTSATPSVDQPPILLPSVSVSSKPAAVKSRTSFVMDEKLKSSSSSKASTSSYSFDPSNKINQTVSVVLEPVIDLTKIKELSKKDNKSAVKSSTKSKLAEENFTKIKTEFSSPTSSKDLKSVKPNNSSTSRKRPSSVKNVNVKRSMSTKYSRDSDDDDDDDSVKEEKGNGMKKEGNDSFSGKIGFSMITFKSSSKNENAEKSKLLNGNQDTGSVADSEKSSTDLDNSTTKQKLESAKQKSNPEIKKSRNVAKRSKPFSAKAKSSSSKNKLEVADDDMSDLDSDNIGEVKDDRRDFNSDKLEKSMGFEAGKKISNPETKKIHNTAIRSKPFSSEKKASSSKNKTHPGITDENMSDASRDVGMNDDEDTEEGNHASGKTKNSSPNKAKGGPKSKNNNFVKRACSENKTYREASDEDFDNSDIDQNYVPSSKSKNKRIRLKTEMNKENAAKNRGSSNSDADDSLPQLDFHGKGSNSSGKNNAVKRKHSISG